jgi:hypothetical protein
MKAQRTHEDDAKEMMRMVKGRMQASHEDGIQKIKLSKKGLKKGLTSDLLAIMGGPGRGNNGMRDTNLVSVKET